MLTWPSWLWLWETEISGIQFQCMKGQISKFQGKEVKNAGQNHQLQECLRCWSLLIQPQYFLLLFYCWTSFEKIVTALVLNFFLKADLKKNHTFRSNHSPSGENKNWLYADAHCSNLGKKTSGCSLRAYILKAKKFAEPPFQSKKLRKKCKSFLVILGHSLVILGHFWPFLGHFVAFLDKFAESSNFLRFRWSHGTRF